jgi:hypothetical protein
MRMNKTGQRLNGQILTITLGQRHRRANTSTILEHR